MPLLNKNKWLSQKGVTTCLLMNVELSGNYPKRNKLSLREVTRMEIASLWMKVIMRRKSFDFWEM